MKMVHFQMFLMQYFVQASLALLPSCCSRRRSELFCDFIMLGGRKQPSMNQAAGFINLLSDPGEREAGRGDVNGDLLNMQPDTCH